MASAEPYRVNIPASELAELQQRLGFTRLPSQLTSDDEWQFGVPLREVERLLEHWKNGFDWRHQEEVLNQLPQYRTRIEVEGFGELDVHCMLFHELLYWY